MADPNIQIPSLPSAASVNNSDLLHVRQGSEDKKATLQVLKNKILNGKDYTGADILTLLKLVDGSGSGLDADLLDGQHGSFYQNASNLNAGTIPSGRLDANDLLTLIKTVDGSGSGLDADLLDGQSSAFYRNASNLNAGTVPSARLPNASTTTEGIIEIATQSQVNSGTSGDLAVIASTLRNNVAYSLGNTGYIRFPSWLGGFTIQWGSVGVSNDSTELVSFPISFSNVFQVVLSQGSLFNPNEDAGAGASFLGNNGFTAQNGADEFQTLRWIAVGIS